MDQGLSSITLASNKDPRLAFHHTAAEKETLVEVCRRACLEKEMFRIRGANISETISTQIESQMGDWDYRAVVLWRRQTRFSDFTVSWALKADHLAEMLNYEISTEALHLWP